MGYYREGFYANNNSVKKIITEDELELFFQTIPDNVNPYYIAYWQNFFYTATEAGLRREEARNLKITDLFLKRSHPYIFIRNQKNKDSNQPLVINRFLSARLNEHCLRYRNEIDYHNGLVFFSLNKRTKGKPVSQAKINDTLAALRVKSGINDALIEKSRGGHKYYRLTFHTLRHYYLNRLLFGPKPLPLQHVQTMARHKSITSTLRYAHQSVKLQEEIMDHIEDPPRRRNFV